MQEFDLTKIEQTQNLFDSIKHINEEGMEFWYARELQEALEYTKWDNFKNVIDKAIEACKGAEIEVSSNFADVGKIVNTGVSKKTIDDYMLSRYACYLIVEMATLEKRL